MPDSWNTVPIPSPSDIEQKTPGATIFQRCESDACVQAHASLEDDRAMIVLKCTALDKVKADRDVAAVVAASAAAIAATLLTVALTVSPAAVIPFIGWAVVSAAWTAFAIAAAAAAAAATASIVSQVAVGKAYAELEEAQGKFLEDARAVRKHCPSQCWGDLTPPSC